MQDYISTHADLVSAIQDRIHRSDITQAEIQDYTEMADARIKRLFQARPLLSMVESEALTTVGESPYVDLPTGFVGIIDVWQAAHSSLLDTILRKLEPKSTDYITTMLANEPSSDMLVEYALTSEYPTSGAATRQLLIYPKPDDGYAIGVRYYKYHSDAEFKTGVTLPHLVLHHPMLWVYATLVEIFAIFQNEKQMMINEQFFQRELEVVFAADKAERMGAIEQA